MHARWAVLACLLACQRTPETEILPRPVPPPPPVVELDEPEPATATQQQEVPLPQPATDFFDFSDGRPRTGDYLIWHRADDYQPDTTYWLSVQATSTEWLGQQDGLWIAARDTIWH